MQSARMQSADSIAPLGFQSGLAPNRRIAREITLYMFAMQYAKNARPMLQCPNDVLTFYTEKNKLSIFFFNLTAKTVK